MANIDFQVQAVNNTLGKLSKDMQKAKKETEKAAGRAMQKAIKAKTPISNQKSTRGNLRKAVGRITGLKNSKYRYIGIRIGKKVVKGGYYAEFLEYGSPRMRPQPFFEKAALSGVPITRSILENGVKVGLQKYKLKNNRPI